jgi:cell division protein ZapA (FtsZ GTPase activity inhibitor)
MAKKTEHQMPINVWLSGRPYRIIINPEDEEIVRKSVKLANDRINELKNNYAGKDEQDFIAMCLVQYAADAASQQQLDPTRAQSIEMLNKRVEALLNRASEDIIIDDQPID